MREHVKKVFLENWYRLTVNLPSPDAHLLQEVYVSLLFH